MIRFASEKEKNIHVDGGLCQVIVVKVDEMPEDADGFRQTALKADQGSRYHRFRFRLLRCICG